MKRWFFFGLSITPMICAAALIVFWDWIVPTMPRSGLAGGIFHILCILALIAISFFSVGRAATGLDGEI